MPLLNATVPAAPSSAETVASSDVIVGLPYRP